MGISNIDVKEYRGELLGLWRNIADSSNDLEFNNKVDRMKLTEAWAWIKNPNILWELGFQLTINGPINSFKLEYDIQVSTNNGIEILNHKINS